jgi:2-keto-4-pentenoate hydratase/2-oxohepta-3-ene-1,7-dioic acid hydratase in catechol pathway
MRLVTYSDGHETRLGTICEGEIVDLGELGFPSTIIDFIRMGPEAWSRAGEMIYSQHHSTRPVSSVRLHAPLYQPSKIIAIGLNYFDHCREQRVEPPKQPLVFGKFPSSITGPSEAIIWNPSLTSQVDPEVELGVIIGQRARHVSAQRALDVV